METDKAAFMGKITAGVTHEIKNVLAIIKESAGLLEDLMSLPGGASQPSQEKYLRIISKIYAQVDRGVNLAAKLNEFAHTPDRLSATADLNIAIDQVVSLSQRFARLKRVRLEAVPREGNSFIVTDPLAFLILLFQSIDLVMNAGGEGTVVRVESVAESKAQIMISADQAKVGMGNPPTSANLSDSAPWDEIHQLASELNMSVNVGGPPPWLSLECNAGEPPQG